MSLAMVMFRSTAFAFIFSFVGTREIVFGNENKKGNNDNGLATWLYSNFPPHGSRPEKKVTVMARSATLILLAFQIAISMASYTLVNPPVAYRDNTNTIIKIKTGSSILSSLPDDTTLYCAGTDVDTNGVYLFAFRTEDFSVLYSLRDIRFLTLREDKRPQVISIVVEICGVRVRDLLSKEKLLLDGDKGKEEAERNNVEIISITAVGLVLLVALLFTAVVQSMKSHNRYFV